MPTLYCNSLLIPVHCYTQYTILVYYHSLFHKHSSLVTITVQSQFTFTVHCQFTSTVHWYSSLPQFIPTVHMVHCNSLLTQFIPTVDFISTVHWSQLQLSHSLSVFIATVHFNSSLPVYFHSSLVQFPDHSSFPQFIAHCLGSFHKHSSLVTV